MIEYYKGTVFNTSADALVNTVNCDGFMGAGIALEFMLRYPNMNKQYVEECKRKIYVPGKVYYYVEDSTTIINFPTKFSFKFPSKIEWVEQGLIDFSKTYKEHAIKKVAFPKLGTNNGGLNWQDVKALMEKYLSGLDIDVVICLDELQESEGIEKTMLDLFNAASLEYLSEIARLNSKQKNALTANRPFDRFWKISRTDTIGKTTYKKIILTFLFACKEKPGNGRAIKLVLTYHLMADGDLGEISGDPAEIKDVMTWALARRLITSKGKLKMIPGAAELAT